MVQKWIEGLPPRQSHPLPICRMGLFYRGFDDLKLSLFRTGFDQVICWCLGFRVTIRAESWLTNWLWYIYNGECWARHRQNDATHKPGLLCFGHERRLQNETDAAEYSFEPVPTGIRCPHWQVRRVGVDIVYRWNCGRGGRVWLVFSSADTTLIEEVSQVEVPCTWYVLWLHHCTSSMFI